MNSPIRVSTPSHPPASSVFSPGVALALAMWIYMVLALVAIPITSVYAHAMSGASALAAGVFLEWLRSRGNKDYATVFLIFLTLAPLLYRYQHG